MSEPRLFLTLMTAAGSEQDLRELVEPIIEWLDGIVAVVHRPCDNDPGAEYLESRKGAGKIIYRDFVQRHHFSMNETLYSGVIQNGDLVLQCDVLERPMPAFVRKIRGEIHPLMQESETGAIFYYGKAYLFRYNEALEYRGSPHWYLTGLQGRAIAWEGIEPDETKVRWNVRPMKRTDPFSWVSHYLKYWCYPAGSNSALLGLEKQGDPQVLFPKVETRRLQFREEVRRRGYPLTADGVVEMFKKELDSTLKSYINESKELNDGYRYLVLGDKTVVDTHRLEDMKRIE